MCIRDRDYYQQGYRAGGDEEAQEGVSVTARDDSGYQGVDGIFPRQCHYQTEGRHDRCDDDAANIELLDVFPEVVHGLP